MPLPDRIVKVDGNAFWMEVEPQGGYIVGAPLLPNGAVEMGAQFELDSRAFQTYRDYLKFKECIRFLTTYRRC